MIFFYTLLIIGLTILIHEAGHLAAARMMSIPVKTFSVGFGPRLIGFTHNGTDYRLSLIPLGGYIEPLLTTEEEFYAIPAYRRVFFALGGVLFNVIFAILMLSAYQILGRDLPVLSALLMGIRKTLSLAALIAASIPTLFTSGSELTGIIGIVRESGAFIGVNYLQMFNFAGILSLNLAVFNLLPLPVLDGGKVLLYAVERILPSIRKISMGLSIAGWIVILGLTVLATANDIVRWVA